MRTSSILSGFLSAVLLVAAPLACHKPAKPSEEFTQARTRFGKLVAEKGDDAFLDPRLAEVETLLAQVPKDSLDASAADELRARIQTGKQQAEAQLKSKNDALAKAREPGQMPSGGGFNLPTQAPPPPPPPPRAAPDAGTPDAGGPSQPDVGTPAAQLASGFNGCFQKGESLNVQGRGLRERWELADRVACRQQYASLQDTVFLIEDGKVLGTAPKSAIQRVPVDAGTPPPPPPTPAP